MLHSTDRITSRATIVEGELKEEGELEPHRQGSIHSRWQRDKGACSVLVYTVFLQLSIALISR